MSFKDRACHRANAVQIHRVSDSRTGMKGAWTVETIKDRPESYDGKPLYSFTASALKAFVQAEALRLVRKGKVSA
jgi:hypothetical protein